MHNDRYSLTEVSQLLGLGALSAFTRWFHERFGTSPSDWRRTARSAAGTAPPSGDGRRPPAPSPETRGTVRGG
jgi:AraC-like DNA-binding protein